MANTTGESKIPIFVSKPLTSRFSTPLANFSNRVRAHLSTDGASRLRSNSGSGLLGILGGSTVSRACKKQVRKSSPSTNTSSLCPSPSSSTSPSPRPSKLFKSSVSDRYTKYCFRFSHKTKPDEHSIGQRVVLSDGKTGCLKYFGETKFEEGVWCGVELDTPDGLNDGSIDGVEYFQSDHNYGIFVPANSVSLECCPVPEKDTGPRNILNSSLDLTDTKRFSDHGSDCEQEGSVSLDLDLEHTPNLNIRKVSATAIQSLSQISTPTPSSTNSSNIPIWEWTLGSQHSSSAGSLSQLQVRSGLNSVDPHNLSLISKHSSCELDESLGILTPDQMNDFTISLDSTCQLLRAVSFEAIESFTLNSESKTSHLISDLEPSSKSNTATVELEGKSQDSKIFDSNVEDCLKTCEKNQDLNLLDGFKECASSGFSCDLNRCLDIDRTPSLEDLPIDFIPEDPKVCNPTPALAIPNSHPTASFVTSITSITSLDNGYQGDGELSRPVSRGADQSPTAHQPIVKLKVVDPMTDSDFFTESDADIHEDLQSCGQPTGIIRGDRRAQVIDGTLYGGLNSSPVKTKSHSQSNTEEMDSSGIYSDLDKRSELLVSSNGNFNYQSENINETKHLDNTDSIDPVSDSVSNLSDLIFQQVNAIKNFVSSVPVVMETVDNQTDKSDGSFNKTLTSDDKEPTQTGSVHQLNEKNKNKSISLAKNVNIDIKKHKMPKRNVTSKIKAMIEAPSPKIGTVDGNEENRRPTVPVRQHAVKKPVGKWDAVMNKIAQNKQDDKLKPCRLKEVKSKVFAGINLLPPKENQVCPPNNNTSRTNSNSQRTGQPLRNLTITQSNSTRSLSSLKSKSRRCRNRGSESNLENSVKSGDCMSRGSSHESSLSEASDSLSKSSSRPSKKTNEASGSSGLPPKKVNNASCPSQKKNNATATNDPKISTKNSETRKNPLRDQNRVANSAAQNVSTSPNKPEVPGGSFKRKLQTKPTVGHPPPLPAPPSVNKVNNTNNNVAAHSTASVSPSIVKSVPSRPAMVDAGVAQAELRHAARAVESLSVLIQYLTVDLDGFSAPNLKKELSKLQIEWLKTKLELEEAQVSYRRLEDELTNQRHSSEETINKLNEKFKHKVAELHDEHKGEINKLSENHENQLTELTKRLDEQATELRTQFTNELECLQKKHEEESNVISQKAKEEFDAYKEECAAQNKKLVEEAEQREKLLKDRLNEVEQQHDALREQSRSIVDGMQNDRDSKLQVTSQYCRKLQDEVDSLRTVLDIRHSELQELRKQNECMQREIDEMPLIRQKLVSAQARVEDLSAQLQRKTLYEKQLSEENRMLNESLYCESEKKQKLIYTVEELQYKLKKNLEIASHLANIKDLSSFQDISCLTSGEKIFSSTPLDQKSNQLCRNLNKEYDSSSTKSRSQSTSSDIKACSSQKDDQSEPKSPKVVSVVKKSDSVSWVLEIEEPSDDVVSRLVRRQSGRGLSQPNSCVSSPIRQDQSNSKTLPNRFESKNRLGSQSSISNKTKKPFLRPRSVSFDSQKASKKSDCSWSEQNDCVFQGNNEDNNTPVNYHSAVDWQGNSANGSSPDWKKDVYLSCSNFSDSCKFSPSKMEGLNSLKIMDQEDEINFDSDFEFFEKSEHFDVIDSMKPGIQITGGEDIASPKFSTSSLTSESSIQSNLSSSHYNCETAGISLEHEEYLLINSNCKNTNKITLVNNRLSPEKRKRENSSYEETSDDEISSSSKYDNETDDGLSGSGSDYLEKDVSYSSQEDYYKESLVSDENSEKEITKNISHSEIISLEALNSNSLQKKFGSNVVSNENGISKKSHEEFIASRNLSEPPRKQKSLENLIEKSNMKDKRSVSLDVERHENAYNYPSFITLENISYINKSIENSNISHSQEFLNCDEPNSRQLRFVNGIGTASSVRLNKQNSLTKSVENGIGRQHSLSVDS